MDFYSQIESNKRKTFLLFFVFIVLAVGIGIVFDLAFTGSFYGIGLFFSILLMVVWSLVSYFSGDKIVLSISGAKKADKKDYPYLINTIDGLAIAAGLPKPEVYVMQDNAINAFATGRDPKHASIAVTTGALEKLNRQELEGVVAHEMSHIKNYDIRTMLYAAVLVGVVSILSDILLRSFLWGGGRSRDRDEGGSLGLILVLVGLVLAVLAPLIANLIKLAISRKREYLADASGAMLTRYPKGLADALKKISNDEAHLKGATNATAHLYISNPFKGTGKFLANLFSTHPPLEDRIRILNSM